MAGGGRGQGHEATSRAAVTYLIDFRDLMGCKALIFCVGLTDCVASGDLMGYGELMASWDATTP